MKANEFREIFHAYQRRQSEGGYTFVPGDEHIFRDAWNLALERAAREMHPMLRDMISRGKACDAIVALRAPLESVQREGTSE